MVTARVSSGDNRVIVQSVDQSDGDEHSIIQDSPLWMGIKIVSGQARRRHFEITLPEDVLDKGRRAFSIRWIDFYR